MPPRGRVPLGAAAGSSRAGASASASSRTGSTAKTAEENQDGDDSSTPQAAPAPSKQTSATPVPNPQPSDTSRSMESATPAASTPHQQPSVSTRGQSSSSRGARAGGSKFLPKAVRRGEAERDAIAQQELKKQSDRLAEDARIRARANKFRGRRGRGRGDTMGARGGFSRPMHTASGPFSQVPSASGSSGPFGVGAGGGELGGSRSDGPSGSFTKGKRDPDGPVKGNFAWSSDERTRHDRVNTDLLSGNAGAYTLGLQGEGGAENSTSSPLPMGLYRVEHKEVEIVVATTAELEAAENAAAMDDDSDTIPEVDEPELDAGEPPIKVEDRGGEAVEMTDIDANRTSEVQVKAPPSPEQKKKVAIKDIAKAPKRRARPRDPEDEAISTDLRLMVSELGIRTPEDFEKSGKTPPNTGNDKEGRMYLFQLPPILPPLHVKANPKTSDLVKPEPNDDMVMLDAPSQGKSSTIDLTADVKTEEGADGEGQDDDEDGHAPKDDIGGGGIVGKLNLRKSGRVELEWGGQVLETMPGTEVNFLTTAILLENFDQKPKAGQIAGHSYGMGRIMGKFVVVPTWGDEQDWVVDPEDLQLD